ncbi:PKD domain-containing protein [Lentzea kentuckyensis]|uniref:PKD domain-containing protein n=1 Tax=Lentzea kentuckyensis TaxID=360086 RepID=UPI000A3BC593|nr:PKD domain-containing protein [Lentzea kentuckyensis]
MPVTPLTRRAQLLIAVVAATASVAVVLVAEPGYHSARMRMHSGTAWLASNLTGEATLVDGASAEVAAKVPLGESPGPLSIAQHGDAALVLNQLTGALSRVDSATLKVSRAPVSLPRNTVTVLKAAPDVIYGADVHSGLVTSVDAGTLEARGEPVRLAESIRPEDLAVDSHGRLWAIDEKTGDLVWLSGAERRTRPAATGTARLAITGDRPAIVDPGRGTAELLSPETGAVTRSVETGLKDDHTVLVGGSADRPRLLIASSTRGELITCTFDTGSCSAPVRISAPGAELGTPLEIGAYAVVPDHSTGRAVVVDLATARVVAEHELFGRPTRFEIVVRDGIVFFNDPNGNIAGVLNLAGDVRTITKYTGGLEGDVPPTPVPGVQTDQVATAGQRDLPPGVGLPWQPKRTSQPNPPPPAPTPAASISVSPGNRGEAGTEFELTMALRQPGPATVRWAFGDGTEATGTTVHHRWHQPGLFTVRAEAVLGTGAKTRAETTITVDAANAPPSIAQLVVRRPKPVIGESVHFSADTTAEPDSWTWTVTKPGAPAPEVTARTSEFDHSFRTPGVYTVSLTITKGIRTAQSSRQVTVAQGAVKAWGSNTHGALEVPAGAASGVIAIDAGFHHVLALKSDGSVLAWGANDYAQTAVPPEASSGVVAISAGGAYSLALKADGTVIGWGFNDNGEASAPPSAPRDVIAIAAGTAYSQVLTANGSVIGWGNEDEGRSIPPPAASSGVRSIVTGTAHTLAVKSDGSVLAWGSENRAGEQSIPAEATVGGVQAVAAGFECSFVLRTNGSVFGWGNPRWGTPDVPDSAKSGVVAIDARDRHVLALKADGSVIGWGHNASGEASVPPQYGSGARAVSVGDGFSVVLLDSAPE